MESASRPGPGVATHCCSCRVLEAVLQAYPSTRHKAVHLLSDAAVDFVPLDLALCAWAFAWLDHAASDAAMLRGIADSALRRLNDFSTQQLANMLWGFDHANYEDQRFYEAVGHWCCSRPSSWWDRAAGEEVVSILTALKPRAETVMGWERLEDLLNARVLQPLASFLRQRNSDEGYTQGLRTLRTYHAGALYTCRLFKALGVTYLGDGDAQRTQAQVSDLIDFYLLPPEPRWLPDGYGDDDMQANRAEIPSLLELLDVKRRVQPSSHFIALHLSAEIRLRSRDGRTCVLSAWVSGLGDVSRALDVRVVEEQGASRRKTASLEAKRCAR